MFNKSSLFPKTPEPQIARSGRLAPGTSTAASGSVHHDSIASVRESAQPGIAHAGASQTPAQVATSAVRTVPEVAAEKSGGSSLIVGPQVKLKGAEILDCDTLVVEGRVEATMDSRVIRIAEHGAFAGTVGIDVAEIHGQFDGELTARHQLIIHATGRVSGKIRYGKILIEEGGEISGDIKALDGGSVTRKIGDTPAASIQSTLSGTGTNG